MRPSTVSKWVLIHRFGLFRRREEFQNHLFCRELKPKCTWKELHVPVRSRSNQNWRRKPIGDANTRNSFKPFAVRKKCRNTWPKVENYPIYRHHRQVIHPTTFHVRTVNGNSMKGLPNGTYLNVQISNSTNRNRTPAPKNDINRNVRPSLRCRTLFLPEFYTFVYCHGECGSWDAFIVINNDRILNQLKYT